MRYPLAQNLLREAFNSIKKKIVGKLSIWSVCFFVCIFTIQNGPLIQREQHYFFLLILRLPSLSTAQENANSYIMQPIQDIKVGFSFKVINISEFKIFFHKPVNVMFTRHLFGLSKSLDSFRYYRTHA